MNPIRNRLKTVITTLGNLRYSDIITVDQIRISEGDYCFAETFNPESRDWQTFGPDETWGGSDRHYWFTASVTVTEVLAGKRVLAILGTGATDIWNTDNPQILVYIDGKMAGTMDMNHQEILLTDQATAGTQYELAFYTYSNSTRRTNFFHLTVCGYDLQISKLYYDMKVPFEAAELLPEEDLERIEAFQILNETASQLDFSRAGLPVFTEQVALADQYLMKHYYSGRNEHPVTVHSVGHTHIDVAWKWPLRQTRQKTVRSFQTVLKLMEQYPEYKFMSSQPQLYEFIKEEAPWLYDQIKERIKEGRWEAEGGMWLEPDCNLASGESLVRHILYGRKFMEGELGGKPGEVLWLPDVFGYSAALPQIMKKSGLSYFMTTKLGWNEFNQFPYDTFMWRGIDGSEVLTYLITTRDYRPGEGAGKPQAPFSTTYNGQQNASQIMGTWQRYQNKDVSSQVLTCYGYGDGGGPTAEMLEESRRMEYSVARCPRTEQTFVRDFFHILEQGMDKKRLPVWFGELYLETHRGTYSSMGENKRYNRMCEFLNGDSEFYSVLAMKLSGAQPASYPRTEIEKNWKLLLLNQFHDILPGSSIQDVYEDSRKQYAEILQSGHELIKTAQNSVLQSTDIKPGTDGLLVYNTLSFTRTGLVETDGEAKQTGLVAQKTFDGKFLYLVPETLAKGFTLFEETEVLQEGRLVWGQGQEQDNAEAFVCQSVIFDGQGRPIQFETPYFDVRFDEQGEISCLYDREEGRSLLKAGMTGNQLQVFEDRPWDFNAWNIDYGYEEKMWNIREVTEWKLLENGPVRSCIYLKRTFHDSVVEQYICFYRHTKRIDFKTRIFWQEHQMLLKAAFPMDILCYEASYDIQFGNVKRTTHRNTSWDQARFEVCAHRWADISESGYGTALLNDCKYGYDIHDSMMRLTLLKSGIFPNPEADQGSHEFTYSLFPHKGDFRTGRVIQEAYDLNCPLNGMAAAAGSHSVDRYSLLGIAEENIFADTIKLAEDGDGIIIRLYEAYGMRTKAHITLPAWQPEAESPPHIRSAESMVMECNCMEEAEGLVKLDRAARGSLELEFKPYEIKTIRVKEQMLIWRYGSVQRIFKH